MSREASRKPEPAQMPLPLPRGLITDQLVRGHLLLCLDFDGTVSELTNDPWKAVPLPRAKNAIAELAQYPEKLTLAIISGRDLDTLLGLLGLRDGLLFAGTHGLEFIGRDGARRFAPGVDRCAKDMEMVREFITRTIPAIADSSSRTSVSRSRSITAMRGLMMLARRSPRSTISSTGGRRCKSSMER